MGRGEPLLLNPGLGCSGCSGCSGHRMPPLQHCASLRAQHSTVTTPGAVTAPRLLWGTGPQGHGVVLVILGCSRGMIFVQRANSICMGSEQSCSPHAPTVQPCGRRHRSSQPGALLHPRRLRGAAAEPRAGRGVSPLCGARPLLRDAAAASPASGTRGQQRALRELLWPGKGCRAWQGAPGGHRGGGDAGT